MKKSFFLNSINYDEQILSNLYNKLKLCLDSDINLYSDYFYPPNVWKKIENMSFDCIVENEGIFQESERRVIKFSSFNNYGINTKNKIILVKIKNKSKFKKLSHKNYLGSLMSLGIKREKLGDLIVQEDSCYFPTFIEIADFIKNNLKTVGKNPVLIEFFDKNHHNISYKFKEYKILVSSFRIDSVISKLCNISRGKAVEIINKGEILLNYEQILDKDSIINLPSIVTIRKNGKFILEKENGITKKEKRYITVKKFI